ncbi:Putative carboxylesterase, type B, carboxylesterase type B, carboxylesterase type B, active [Colletotrichum destructivum]|uniref:Carboxylic ester hydrolase n=1 Tax=Colletotrichum destructivum TaxID=34406 RepID=A0AAX4IXN2_9PEZI|nr:Putative carboxylesterase, type B, carboxylesterase type B, carboxylesterase type B, active [Colletotrichum destructivum]
MRQDLLLLSLVASSSATAISVELKHGTVVGQQTPRTERFLAIPYAEPPIGPNRFKPPVPLQASFGTHVSPAFAPACVQTPIDLSEYANNPATMSVQALDFPFNGPVQNETEDCLTVDVVRPTNTTAESKLPVFFWSYGGGFMNGATQQYTGDKFVGFSVDMGQPVIYVAPNYRVGVLGFLPGSEIKAEGSSNAGLRDQRLALQWVQENIAQFGGDPDRVTIMGESAGAHSVVYQTIINRGNHTWNGKPLFRGAIQSSGAPHPLLDIDAVKPQGIYDRVVDAASCRNATNTLDCLRELSTADIVSAGTANPGPLSYRGLDGSYRPRPDDSDDFLPVSSDLAFQSGAYANVSFINGNTQDEGAFFSQWQTNVTTVDQLVDYFTTALPDVSRSLIAGFVDTYSLDPAAGSPYNTGTENQLYPMYKLLASVAGDSFFIFNRRMQLQLTSRERPSWSFLVSSYSTPWFGNAHGVDLYGIFSEGTRQEVTERTQSYYYVNFVNHLDPNGKEGSSPPGNMPYVGAWPRYTPENPAMLQYLNGSNVIIPDTFRAQSYEYYRRTASAWKA